MQVAATLPATGVHFFPTRRASFKCNGYSSPLKPIARASSINAQSLQTITPTTTTTEMTKKHLSNLEKLLQKEAKPEPVIQKQGKTGENRGKQGEKTEENRGRNLLEGLNLSRIWPEMKAAEEMSPRHLIRLHRMLSSKSMEYSPRNNLGSRWKEYHGCKDWLGLLDPLDENLRRELVRYGEFIQAAYHCFHSDPATSANENAHVAKDVSLPDRSYKVTKSLYATSSIGLPKWVDDVAPDLGWMTQRSSWIGYVAVCDDKTEIQRMGRRDIVIALRGTATCLEWGENLRDVLVQMPGENELVDAQPKVECGFLSLYKTGGAKIPSLAESVTNEVKRLIEMYKGESLSITVTGHSLGAALALLVADDISTCSPNAPPVAVFSFGGPRVGNKGFANRLESKNVKVLRIVNKQDVITKVPGMFVSEAIDKKLRDTGASGVLNLLDNSMPWAYSHVGTELRVDTTKSPFLKPDADVACCHDLEAYLHLVDGYLGSNESFRPNAKRSLEKLLNEQSANIKKLYTSKGKDLSSLNLNREINFPRPSCLPSPSVLPSPSS